jgi:hypothetical protein
MIVIYCFKRPIYIYVCRYISKAWPPVGPSYIYIYIYVYMFTCIYIYIYVYIHIYIYIKTGDVLK